VDGILRHAVSAHKLARHLVRRVPRDALPGVVVEFDGEAIAALSVAGRAVLCAAVRAAGAVAGIVAPDGEADHHLGGPARTEGEPAEALVSSPGARFDLEVYANAATIDPRAA